MGTDTEAQRRVAEAFRSFETSLREMLAAEARESVNQTLERLSVSAGPFRVEDVQVEVVIRGLRVEAAQDHDRAPTPRRVRKAAAPARRSNPRNSAPRKPSGRPPGALRSTLLETFEQTEGELNTDALRKVLDARGVTASTDNLHQQLRRLVTAGLLERSGRGRYRRA
jgi:hypothetical protein